MCRADATLIVWGENGAAHWAPPGSAGVGILYTVSACSIVTLSIPSYVLRPVVVAPRWSLLQLVTNAALDETSLVSRVRRVQLRQKTRRFRPRPPRARPLLHHLSIFLHLLFVSVRYRSLLHSVVAEINCVIKYRRPAPRDV